MKLMDRMLQAGKRRRLADSTVECYQRWTRQFLIFHKRDGKWRHPRELRGAELAAFLTYLANDRRCSASTQNQAANGIVFLYSQVLVDELGEDHLGRFRAERAKRPGRVPTVLSVNEVTRLLAMLTGCTLRKIMT